MFDRVKETATTAGTGNFTLAGAVAAFETFATNAAVGQRFFYTIVAGTSWEVGEGYLSDATTLVRETVLNSTNSDALVSFAAGTKIVFATFPSARALAVPTRGQVLALASATYIR